MLPRSVATGQHQKRARAKHGEQVTAEPKWSNTAKHERAVTSTALRRGDAALPCRLGRCTGNAHELAACPFASCA
jgi:hypothetical protein